MEDCNGTTPEMVDREIAYAQVMSELLYEASKRMTIMRRIIDLAVSVIWHLRMENMVKRGLRRFGLVQTAERILRK